MVTRELVLNCLSTSFDQIPDEVKAHGKLSLLNWLGVTIGAIHDESIDILVDMSKDLQSAKQVSLFGREEKVDLLMGALINGTASHIYDYDDTHLDTIHHPSGPIAPVVLALGEHLKLSGEEMLHAFIIGCEAELRIANAVYPSHYQLGWHITSTTGVFGAAIAAGLLLKLDEEKLSWALGIAGTQSSGLREVFGTMSKPFHPGKAAQNGLLAALLAEKGFTSSKEILEAKRGFANVLAPEHDLSKVNIRWGEDWELAKNSFKPYACGIVLHPSIDACIHLKQKVAEDDLDYIELQVNPYVLELTGKQQPKTGLEGKFSIYFTGAVAFLTGEASEKQYTDEFVKDPVIVEMQKKIRAIVDETIKEEEVVAKAVLRDGTSIVYEVQHAKGSLENPMSVDDVIRKFKGLATGVWSDEAAVNQLIQRVLDVENVTSVEELLTGGN